MNTKHPTRVFFEVLGTSVLVALFVIGVVAIPMACQAEAYVADPVEEEEDKGVARCELFQITDQDTCMKCHETRKVDGKYVNAIIDNVWQHLPYNMKLITESGQQRLYYLLTSLDADDVFDAYEYAKKNGITSLVIEINSPGGSVVEAWRIIGLMKSYPNIHTETRCFGMAASAGFIILQAGDTRVVSPRSMMMIHELRTFSFFKMDTPAGSEHEAEIMKIWQGNINDFLAEKSTMTAEEISDKIQYENWWLIGNELLALGFADQVVWGNVEEAYRGR